MNIFPTILYFADILTNIQVLFGITAAACALFGFSSIIGVLEGVLPSRWPKILLLGTFVFAAFASVIPTRETLLLIIGSEIGEEIVSHPETIGTLSDVKDIVKMELGQIKRSYGD